MNSLESARKKLLTEILDAVPDLTALVGVLNPTAHAQPADEPELVGVPDELPPGMHRNPGRTIETGMSAVVRLLKAHADFERARGQCARREGVQFDVPGTIVRFLVQNSDLVGDPLAGRFVEPEAIYVLSSEEWRALVAAVRPENLRWEEDILPGCEALLAQPSEDAETQ